ncbi:hypothetical protein Ancab_033603 [Ancistrocladus abbreviatus]
MAVSPFLRKTLHLLLLFPAFAIFLNLVNADPPYRYCPDTSNKGANGHFRINVNNLLSSLTSNASVTKFYYTSIGNNPNTAYGLFFCMNFVADENCKNCGTMAAEDITSRCPTSTDATVWEDNCQLRVSDQNFFGHLNVAGNIPQYNHLDISDPDKLRFRSFVNATLFNIAEVAAFNASAHMYAEQQVAFTETDIIYAAVQCTPDLSPIDCSSCLRKAITDVLVSYQYRGGRLLSRSCYLRYEFYDFYDGAAEEVAPPGNSAGKSNHQERKVVVLLLVVALPFIAALLSLLVCCAWKQRGPNKAVPDIQIQGGTNAKGKKDLQYDFEGQNNPFFSLSTIHAATDFFSDANKLGQGGFGAVYKGKLSDGTPVAVKRLSGSSEQGSEEFTNEVLLIMKLQHKNLVKLLGFCVDGEERQLVYELLPNKSLDYFLYDPQRRAQLNWSRRLNIINGIARGILYLHDDSRLRIVHRDLKPSNVLLDSEMNPKISDFGMARIWGENEDDASTALVVGTYGYMAPEYAMEGIYSTKTDVFSFGIILLEILTGRKSIGFHLCGNGPSLQAYAWQLWSQDKGLELMDPLLIDDNSYRQEEFLRYLQIALLCVQEEAIDRPTMFLVIRMLKWETADLHTSKHPAFFNGSFTDRDEACSSKISSVKSLTVTDLSAR